jgi:hypothetical protein
LNPGKECDPRLNPNWTLGQWDNIPKTAVKPVQKCSGKSEEVVFLAIDTTPGYTSTPAIFL